MPLQLRLRPEVLAAAVLSCAALWGAIAWTLYQARTQAIESAATMRQSMARTLAEYQDASVRAIDLSLMMLRDEWRRDPPGFDAAVARQEQFLRREKVIQVAVVDADGHTLYSRLPTAGPPQNFRDRGYFRVQRDHATDELHISEPVLGRITKQWAIQVTRPLRDATGRFEGLIVVAVPPPALETVYRELSLGPEGVVTLLRDDGTILARTGDFGRVADYSLANVPGLSAGSPVAGDYRVLARIDGVERFYSYRKLQNYPLTVFVGQNAEVVLAPYYGQRQILLVTGALATALLAALLLVAGARARDRRRFREQREQVMLDLHDSSIQSLYAVGLQLESCRRLAASNPEAAVRTLTDAKADLGVVIQDLRALIAGEPAAPLSEQAFLDALGRAIPAPGPGVPAFALEIDPLALAALTGDQAIHVQRIAREAVSNVVRHASARNARLSLSLDGRAIRLAITDDGEGDARSRGEGLGLQHIDARARKLGGRAAVEFGSTGTRVTVEFPRK
jgi:signal transduction histidine kinase